MKFQVELNESELMKIRRGLGLCPAVSDEKVLREALERAAESWGVPVVTITKVTR